MSIGRMGTEATEGTKDINVVKEMINVESFVPSVASVDSVVS